MLLYLYILVYHHGPSLDLVYILCEHYQACTLKPAQSQQGIPKMSSKHLKDRVKSAHMQIFGYDKFYKLWTDKSRNVSLALVTVDGICWSSFFVIYEQTSALHSQATCADNKLAGIIKYKILTILLFNFHLVLNNAMKCWFPFLLLHICIF